MDLDRISKLIEFVGSSRVSELSVSEAGVTVRIIRTGATSAATAPHADPTASHVAQAAITGMSAQGAGIAGQPADAQPTTPQATTVPQESHTATAAVSAPSYGLFHRSPSPGAKPFVEVGDVISEGQDLFIIEAMKVFNTVKADRSGRIVRIEAEDGQDVELGQVILELA